MSPGSVLQADHFIRQLDQLHARLAALPPGAVSGPASELLNQAMSDLAVTVEELRVAEEELRQQADELAAANDQLDSQRRRYHNLFDHVPAGYLVTNADGVISEANQAAGHLLARTPARLRGKPLSLFVAPASLPTFRDHLRQGATAAEPLTWEMRLRRPKGQACIVTCRLMPLRDPVTNALVELRWFLQDVTHRRQAEAEAESARTRLAEVSARMESVRESERRRIAQAVHDEIGAALTAIKIDISQVRHGLEQLGPGRAGGAELLNHAGAAIQLIDETMQTVRRIAMEMRPAILDDFGLVAALDWQLSEFQKRTGIACEFNVTPGQSAVPSPLATALYRVFQEILTNISRHAAASQVQVRLYQAGGHLALHVQDNGRGLDPAAEALQSSLGILGMHERVRPFGGSVRLEGRPGQGTTVRVTVPLE